MRETGKMNSRVQKTRVRRESNGQARLSMYTKLRTISTDWGMYRNQSGELNCSIHLDTRVVLIRRSLFRFDIDNWYDGPLFSLAVKLCELDWGNSI